MQRIVHSPRADLSLSGGYCVLSWLHHFVPSPVNPSEYLEDAPLSSTAAKFFVLAFSTNTTGDRFLHDEVALCWPKGSAKSLLGAYFCEVFMFGPSMPVGIAKGGESISAGDWHYEFTAGEVLMEPRYDPRVAVLATTKEQARQTMYQWVYRHCGFDGSERLRTAYRINPFEHVAKTRLTHPVAGELNVVATEDSEDAADGGLQSLVMMDESHRMRGNNKNTLATYRQNLYKRPCTMLVQTSTAYGIGENSALEDFFAEIDKIEAGETPNDDKLLFHTLATPGSHDMATIDGVLAALDEVYAPCPWIQTDRIARQWFDSRADISMLNRLYLGIHSTPSRRWLVHEDIAAVTSADPVWPGPKELVALGLDASRGRSGLTGLADSTALIGCVLSADPTVEPMRLFPVKIWEADTPSWVMPLDDLAYVVQETFKKLNVVGFLADPPYIESLIATWHRAYHKQLYTGKAGNRISFWTNQERAMTSATEAYERAIIDKEVRFADDPVFLAHHRNAERKPSRLGYVLAKKSPKSLDKIDAAVSGVLAFKAARDAVQNGALLGTKNRQTFAVVQPVMT